MSKENRDLALVALFLLAMMFFLARRRRPREETSVNLGKPVLYGEIGVPIGPRESLNTALVRICTYEKSAIEWRLGDACPPNYQGQNLVADTLANKLPYDPSGGQTFPVGGGTN